MREPGLDPSCASLKPHVPFLTGKKTKRHEVLLRKKRVKRYNQRLGVQTHLQMNCDRLSNWPRGESKCKMEIKRLNVKFFILVPDNALQRWWKVLA